ncbi:MAG TPA: asparagine synthase-related protein [Vicinamibacterales bacterium]
MSGFAAILHTDGSPVPAALIGHLTASIEHRGSHGASVTCGPLGFGARVLLTTPESRTERQPLDDDGDWLVFDGRLDDRAGLAQELAHHGWRPTDSSDAAFVLAACRCWGGRAPSRLIGEFALVFWNARDRELMCSRDVLGLRPLYYASTSTSFVAGSELQQVLRAPGVSAQPDEMMVGEFLSGYPRSREGTLFRAVRRLPAGHTLSVTREGLRIDRYWQPEQLPPIRHRDDRQYVEHFADLFERAVSACLRSASPPALLLSGGFDSSSVAAVAARCAPGLLKAYTTRFPSLSCDEGRYARLAVDACGIDAREIPYVPATGALFVAEATRYRDMPQEPAGVAMALARRAAREDGRAVQLTGCGGDEWFFGSLYHLPDLLRRGDVGAFWRHLHGLRQLPDYGFSAALSLRIGLWFQLRPSMRRAVKWLLGRGPLAPDYICPSFARRTGLADRLHRTALDDCCADFARVSLLADLQDGTFPWTLELNERSAAGLGVELRHPLYDRRIVEFGLGLPEDQRWRGPRTKWIVREAMRELLPPALGERYTKAEFSEPWVHALEALGGADFFARLRVADAGWVDASRAVALYERMRRAFAAGDLEYARLTTQLWSIAGVELWYQATCDL